MAHKYYDDLGLEKDAICLFNTDVKEKETVNGKKKASKRQKKWNKMRKKYGFDSRETWSLDFTMNTWLHSHLKMFLDEASDTIDLSYHKVKIPVLVENPYFAIPKAKLHTLRHVRPFLVRKEHHTLQECIEIMIKYLEDVLLEKETFPSEQQDGEESWNSSIINDWCILLKQKAVYNILAECVHLLWW